MSSKKILVKNLPDNAVIYRCGDRYGNSCNLHKQLVTEGPCIDCAYKHSDVIDIGALRANTIIVSGPKNH